MAAMALAPAALVPVSVAIIAMAAALEVLAVVEEAVALAMVAAAVEDVAMIALVVAAAEVLAVLVLALLLSAAWVDHVTTRSLILGPMAAVAMPMVSVWVTMAAAVASVPVTLAAAAAVDPSVVAISATMDSVVVAQMISVVATNWAAAAVPAICPAWVTLVRAKEAAVAAVPVDSVAPETVWPMV